MIIVKLWGGLGNQLFQYCFGYALSKKYNDSLFFDIEFYNKQPKNVGKRSVQLVNYFSVSNFHTIERPKQVSFFENKFVNRIIRVFPGFRFKLPNNYFFVKERTHRFMKKIPYRPNKINYYDGYWQSLKYFEDYLPDVLKEVAFKPSLARYLTNLKWPMSFDNSVAIHIRRGDFVMKKNLPKGYSLKKLNNYYLKAISYIRNTISNPVFYVFSDDINWCKEFLSCLPNAIFINSSGEYPVLEDFYGIMQCKNGIASASTFSWWSNFMARNDNRIVVIPDGDYSNNYYSVDNWIKI